MHAIFSPNVDMLTFLHSLGLQQEISQEVITDVRTYARSYVHLDLAESQTDYALRLG